MNLTNIASAMRRELVNKQSGATKRILFGGLVVVLDRDGDHWRLAIGREGAPPSKTEARVFSAHFNLPAGVEWAWVAKEQKRCVYGQRGVQVYVTRWQVAEARWIERAKESAARA
ncbi:MAG: hypothetical protein U0350_36475 [Caldilineaceae bacterium]